MGLETVKEEIIRNAEKNAESLIAAAREESNKIREETEKKIAEIKENSDAEAKRLIEVIKQQELASAKLESKKLLLEAKKQLIENVFVEAQKNLESLDTKKREAYIKKLIEKAKNDIEVSYVYCNKKDLKALKELKPEAIGIIGGLIAENSDRTIRVDYSFDTMLESIKENELQNINKILFG